MHRSFYTCEIYDFFVFLWHLHHKEKHHLWCLRILTSQTSTFFHLLSALKFQLFCISILTTLLVPMKNGNVCILNHNSCTLVASTWTSYNGWKPNWNSWTCIHYGFCRISIPITLQNRTKNFIINLPSSFKRIFLNHFFQFIKTLV